MRKQLTQRQQAVYNFIVDEIRRHGMPPTIREIGQHFGMRSSNGAREALNALVRKEYIRRRDRISRGITLVDPEGVARSGRSTSTRAIPFVETADEAVSCASPPPGTNYTHVDRSLVSDGAAAFALHVSQDMSVPPEFAAGDVVVANLAVPPRTAEFVVIDDGARLGIAARSNSDPNRSDGGANREIGVVCCVMRRFPSASPAE